MNTEVLGISTDSVFSHKVFKDVSPLAGKVQYPLVSDRNHMISRAYRVLDVFSGASVRATIIVAPDGFIASKLIYPSEVGRNAYEILRLVQALQFGEQSQSGVPANWLPGMPGLNMDTENIGRF
ncbi:peroxiredoxin [Fictibacillus sp. S7]|uniref:Alkyl hydroperoxide reductase n=1 Tax=Fictibacillus enclensis TaxID=1017270 RepID=A0A0V8J1T7_9BACL|nr:alkyl hydroperoxide reductase [Fictibacillus enclensis]RXZ00455.1 peroxiredoxin [Fictibacillus sp. S7]